MFFFSIIDITIIHVVQRSVTRQVSASYLPYLGFRDYPYNMTMTGSARALYFNGIPVYARSHLDDWLPIIQLAKSSRINF